MHWGFQPLLHKDQTSSFDWNCKVQFKIVASHIQILITKGHLKNKWKKFSSSLSQKEHIEGNWQPLKAKLSPVGSLSNISLQTRIDLEGGISFDQISLSKGLLENDDF